MWAIAKGSFINKLLILPVVFLLSAYASWLIIPILLIGGIYLAYEGAEKIYEYFVPHMDDFGYKLMMIDDGNSKLANKIGQILVDALPKVIKILTIVGLWLCF